jgi:hypothetical protein
MFTIIAYFFLIFLSFLSTNICAATIYIPDDYPEIQEGIDAAQAGDSVLVRPGTYFEQINLKNGIYIKSEMGPLYTTIDAEYLGHVVDAFVPVDTTTVLDGFTVTGGTGWGAISLGLDSPINISPTIRKNIIRDNKISGVLCHGVYSNSSPIIEENIICNNRTYGGQEDGGGIRINASNPIIRQNIILYNKALNSFGGGISCYQSGHSPGPSKLILSDNIICNNSAAGIGGGLYLQGNNSLIQNNVFVNNESDAGGGGIFCANGNLNIINNNLIVKNTCHSNYWETWKDLAGGGICFSKEDSSTIINNTIYGNITGHGGAGIHLYKYGTYPKEGPFIINNIISENMNGAGIDCEYYINGSPIISYNDLWENEFGDYAFCEPGIGDISENPVFICPQEDECRLFNCSPCIDTGDPEFSDPDQTRSDMGYYYFDQTHPVLFYFTPIPTFLLMSEYIS